MRRRRLGALTTTLLACGAALAGLALGLAFITLFFVIAALGAIACMTAGVLGIPMAPASRSRTPRDGQS